MRTKPVLLFLFFFLPAWAFSVTDQTERQDSASPDIPSLEKTAQNRRDAAVFYDLGVLYSNSGNTGKAVLNFKKAFLLRPSDREAAANLNALRQSIGIPPYFSDSSPIEKAVLAPFLIFSLNAALVFGLALFVLGSAAISLVLSNRFRFPRMDTARTISIVLICVGAIYIVSSVIRYRFTFDNRNAVILQDTKLLERPDGASLSLADIPGGMECGVRDEMNGYFRVSTLDGREGWVIGTGMERLWDGEK